jgi:hypothetical protein
METTTSDTTDQIRPAETGSYALGEPLAPRAADRDDGDHNPVFTALVQQDSDVVGLVAYSIYKQNKYDWLLAFRRTKGREPDEAELGAYIIGESTPRRLAIYRHLAEATLSGKGPEVSAGVTPEAYTQRSLRSSQAAGRGETALPKVLSYVVLAVVVALAVLLAVRFGLVPVSH